MKKTIIKKKKKVKIGFFISDDGYGHVVRQSSIIKNLNNYKNQNIEIHIFGKNIKSKLRYNFSNKIFFNNFDNIIKTTKEKNGSLDLKKTYKIFADWTKNKKKLIQKTKQKIKNFDLIISDSVPHAICAARDLKIKTINISHFTWDWFYLKTFGNDEIYKQLSICYKMTYKFIFPPLTEKFLLNKYKKKIHKINFIITDSFNKKNYLKKNHKKICIIMDNGSKVLSKKILKILKYLKEFNSLKFIICGNFFDLKTIKLVNRINHCKIEKDLKKIHKYISSSSFLIARGGYNTITECLILNKPTLLYKESKNVEVRKNVDQLVKMKLTKSINDKFFTIKFNQYLNKFLKKDYLFIKKRFDKYNFKNNGSEQASKIILSCIS